MATSPPVTAEALAAALAQLPSLSAASAELNPIRIAIARAIVSGQDPGQLALDEHAGRFGRRSILQSHRFRPSPGQPLRKAQPTPRC